MNQVQKNEMSSRQKARAEKIARELAGDKATPGLVRAMLDLVKSDESNR